MELNINFKKPSGQNLAVRFLKITGYALTILSLMTIFQSLIVDQEKSLVTIAMSFFLLAMGSFMTLSAKEVFKSKFLMLINGLTIIILYGFLAAMAKINLMGGIVAFPLMICLYIPTFVMVRDVFSTPKNKRVITGKILYAKYFYYFAFICLAISLIIDSATADFN